MNGWDRLVKFKLSVGPFGVSRYNISPFGVASRDQDSVREFVLIPPCEA